MFDTTNDPNMNPSNEPSLDPPPAGESSNRTFMVAVGILGGLVLLTIICIVVYAFVLGPRMTANTASQRATAEAHNQQIAQAMTATAFASQWTTTPLPSPVIQATNTPSPTPVVNLPAATATSIYDPLTATMAALYTQAAVAQLTPTSTLVAPAGSLPQGGIADEYGIPGLMLMAAVLVGTIFLARRLRMAPIK